MQSTSASADDRIEFANTLRGIAALLVLISHYFWVFWLNNPVASELAGAAAISGLRVPGFIKRLSIAPLDWGAVGVSLFFLISGFVIPFSFNRYSVRGFILGRLLRIYPTYFAGFAVSVLSLVCTTSYFGTSFPYSLREVLLHVPGLRELAGSRYIDGILWTLEVEIKFYLVCALIAPWLRRGSLLVFLVPAAIFVAVMAITPWLSHWHTTRPGLYVLAFGLTLTGQYIVYMFVGVALHYAFRRVQGEMAMTAMAAVLFFAMTYLWKYGVTPNVPHFAWSYGFSCVVFVASMVLAEHFKRNRVTEFLADISYPLYVSHPVFGYAMLRITVGAGLPPWICVTITTAAALALAYAIHILVERPSLVIGRRLASSSRVGPKRVIPMQAHAH